jgi:hypothetical protein
MCVSRPPSLRGGGGLLSFGWKGATVNLVDAMNERKAMTVAVGFCHCVGLSAVGNTTSLSTVLLPLRLCSLSEQIVYFKISPNSTYCMFDITKVTSIKLR